MGSKGLLWLMIGMAVGLLLLFAGCSGQEATPTPAATSTPILPTATPTPLPRTISGRISYTGSALANYKIIVIANRKGDTGPPAYAAIVSGVGSYTLGDVADSTYTVSAFIDLGDDMGPPEPNEPFGWYDPNGDGVADPVVMNGGNPVTGIDIILRDPGRQVGQPLAFEWMG